MCKLSPWQASSQELEKERRGLLGQPKAAARGGQKHTEGAAPHR